MNVLLYAKAKASNDKRDRKHDVKARLRALRKFAVRQSWTVVGEFSDKPLDAWDDRRGFIRLLARVMMGGVQAILVTNFDQVGLNTRQFTALADELHDKGVSIVGLREGHELGAPMRSCFWCMVDLTAWTYKISKVLGR